MDINYRAEIDKVLNYPDEKLVKLEKDLMDSIYSGSGKGFWNCDMGHPSYVIGAKHGAEEKIDDPVWGDGPEKSSLYQLIKAVHSEMTQRNIAVTLPIRNWKDFCSLAIETYNKMKRER